MNRAQDSDDSPITIIAANALYFMKQSPKNRFIGFWLFLGLFVGCAGGCNILTPAIYLIEGPPTVDAEYVLPNRPIVVFVDDRANLLSPVSLRRVIADEATEQLMKQAEVVNIIRPADALAASKRGDKSSSLLPIGDIGKAVGAEIIIYIEMTGFTLSPDGYSPRPMAQGRVRVYDVNERTQLYPTSEDKPRADAKVVMTEIGPIDPAGFRTSAQRRKLFSILAESFGQEVAKLFYEHERRELGGNLNPR